MVRLSPAARADGHRLRVHDSLPSTSTEALALARAGETGPLWIVAQRQTAGRGRRGAVWHAPEGNLAASLLLPLTGVAPEQAATLGFVAGLALVQALDDVWMGGSVMPPSLRAERSNPAAPSSPASSRRLDCFAGARNDGETSETAVPGTSLFALKWPNDVLADGKKIAGILLEAEGRSAVAVGFGVNVAAAPEGLPYPATALAALGCGASAADLFMALSERFVETLRIWNKGRGFSAVRRSWLARAAGLGGPVTVRTAQGRLQGRHQGIDEGGRLIILAPDGTTHTVTAGEVHFGEAATAA